MEKRKVELVYKEKKYEVEVPDYVKPSKEEYFKRLWLIERELADIDKFYTFSDGKTYKLPLRNWKKVCEPYSVEEVQDFREKTREINTLNGKRLSLKASIDGGETARKRKFLQDKWGPYMLEMFGRDFNATDIHRKLVSQGIDIEYDYVRIFFQNNREKIRELRNTYREEYSDVSISVKRSRLEKLNYILNELLQDFEKAPTPEKRIKLATEVRGILEQARKEVEGDELKLTVNGRIDIEATLTVLIDNNKILQGLTINQLVISRVAARLGLRSQYLIDRLAYGFYARFNGFRRNEDLSTKPIYPSSVNYDILDLEQKNKEISKSRTLFVEEAQVLEEVQIDKAKTAKEMILQKLSELKKQNNETKEEFFR